MLARHGEVAVERLLDLHAYDGQGERPDKFEERGAHLDSAVGTVSLQAAGETSLAAAESFLGRLLWETEAAYPGCRVLRCKGILAVRGEERQVMVQGVHDTYDTYETREWTDGLERKNTLVIIGKNLEKDKLQSNFTIALNGISE